MHKYPSPQNNDKRTILGIILVGLGIIFLLKNLGIFPSSLTYYLFNWQTFLITLGVIFLFNRRNKNTAIVLIVIGTFFLMPRIFLFPISYRQIFWPLVLIAIGVVFIFRHLYNKKSDDDYLFDDTDLESSDKIDEAAIFSGSKRRIRSKNFAGGKITSIFGGVEVDLSHSDLEYGMHLLDVLTVFGGTKIIVPADWHVRLDMVSIFGGFSDKRHFKPNGVDISEKTLVIKGIALFGGGELFSARPTNF